jgi:hypothetical protein
MSTEISAKAFVILRFLSQIINANDVSGHSENELDVVKDKFAQLQQFLNPAEKRVVVDVVKAAILLTAGYIEVIDDPTRFNGIRHGHQWRSIDQQALGPILSQMLGVENFARTGEEITRADYQRAKELLPIAAQASAQLDALSQLANVLGRDVDAPSVQAMTRVTKDPVDGGEQLLYRGIKDISPRKILVATQIGSTWRNTRGVSTSIDFATAWDFASSISLHGFSSSTASIIFTIKNETEAGIDMKGMSNFAYEEEVILSGNLRINSWRYDCDLEIINGSSEYSYVIVCDEGGSVTLTISEVGSDNKFVRQMSLGEGQQVIMDLLSFDTNGVNPPYYEEAVPEIYADGSVVRGIDSFRRSSVDILGVNATMERERNMKAKTLASRLGRLRKPKK